MAFVYRSNRTNISEKNKTSLGPGEYDEELSKTQGRDLHKKNLKYSTILKHRNNPLIIPFNTTSQRSKLFDGDDTPGPGAYSLMKNYKSNKAKMSFGNASTSLEKEIQELFPNLSKNKKGFLTSEKRFSENSSKEKIIPGPGSYELRKPKFINLKNYNNIDNKYIKEKYAMNKGKIYKLPGSSEQMISSIPDKSKGEFKLVKGLLVESKKDENDSDKIGPGKYNIYLSWKTNGIDWDKGYKKEDKNDKYKEDEIQKQLEKNSSLLNNNESYSERMRNFNNNISSFSTNYKAFQKSLNLSSTFTMTNTDMSNHHINKSNNNFSISGWNTSTNLGYNSKSIKRPERLIRNKIFSDFIKGRENLHFTTMSKLKDENNLVMDIEYHDKPGPGFYNQNIIPKHTSFMSTASNFGSNSPKFKMPKIENGTIGPGTYFKERNKYEPKKKIIIYAKAPEKPKEEINDSVYVQNLIRSNEEKMPGPGEYNLERKFTKKEISNINSFGSKVERFSKTPKEKNKIKDELIDDNDVREYINRSLDEEERKDKIRIRQSLYLKKMELMKQKEKEKRQKYLKQKMPSVGTYSPELISTIKYQVLSKTNIIRNQIAPFNIVDSRFALVKNPRIKITIPPGPGDYNILPAFKALNSDKRKYNVFGQNKQRDTKIRNTFVPGPGNYNLDNPNIWDIKSYNALFINKPKYKNK